MRKALGIVVGLLLGVGAGFALSWAWITFLGDFHFPNRAVGFLYILALMLLSMYAQVVLHEAGHLLFGLASGYSFSSFRIFNFIWIKTEGKIRFKRLSIAGTAGQCLMIPPPLKEGKIPVKLYNLGGVVVNFIVSALALGLLVLCRGNGYAFLGLSTFAFMGILLGATNGIPMKVGQVDNDGANALSLGKSPRAIYAFWLQMQINAELAQGKRLKDLPKEWFEFPSDDELQNTMLATLGVFNANYLMDVRDFEAAKAAMEKLLSLNAQIIGVHKNLTYCDLMYIALVIDKDEGKAKALYAKELQAFMKSMKKFPTVVRTQYAYAALVERDEEKAGKLLALFERVERSYPYEGDIASERELVELVKNGRKEVLL